MADERQRVTLEDVVEILVKHASSPNDPDDAETLSLFNQQVADDREKATAKPEPPQKGKP